MKNRFIACGGTGAHVMLAMVRMHILGYPFGFFFNENCEFPDLFLVDQDSGDGKSDKSTAWQEVKDLIESHPGKKYDLNKHLGNTPTPKDISPLPVGKDKVWYKRPHHQLEFKFKDSQILRLITSQEQRDIKYDHGMMASPATGALLFSLKELDREKDSKSNHDEAYDQMINDCDEYKIVVCGSSVGGTGSSVAPTLTRLCKSKGSEVMAVMIHNWFKFPESDDTRDIFEKSVERNKRMKENAAGGLACYGDELAQSVPTVLVGVPVMTERQYTTDNQQPLEDSYAHVVGALSSIKHFFAKGEDSNYTKGLYGMSASDTSRLTGDLIVRNKDKASLKTMLGHAQILIYVLKAFSKVLIATSKRNPSKDKSSFFNFFAFGGHTPMPSVAHWAYTQLDHDRSSLEYAGKELDLIIENYELILKWIKDLDWNNEGDSYYDNLDVERKSKSFFLDEINCIERLKKHRLPQIDNNNSLEDKEFVALALFHWTADWIKGDWKKVNLKSESRPKKKKGYWPEIKSEDDTGMHPTWIEPGELGKVADGKISSVITKYFDIRDVSPNSWPHHFAVTEQYKFQIINKDADALGKLKLLLLGRALNVLNFQKVESGSNQGNLSLDQLIKGKDIAKFRLIHKESGKIYGFNSPQTLLCPVPDISNEDWKSLEKEVDKEDVIKASRAIKGWLKSIESYVKNTVEIKSTIWVDVLDYHFNAETGPFGVAEWLPLPHNKVLIPIPILGPSTCLFLDDERDKEIATQRCQDFLDRVSEFKEVKVRKSGKSETFQHIEGFHLPGKVGKSGKSERFQLIENFRLPGSDYPIKAIWREHLDALQESTKIFAWEIDADEKGIWIREKLGDRPIYIEDIQVIDKEKIKIQNIIPLEQRPVSVSSNKELKYPDIPLRPEYIDLLKVPTGEKYEGEKCIDHSMAWEALKQSGLVDHGRKIVRWKLDLLGRSEQVPIAISVENIEPSRAHWMIWPNIKSPINQENLWQAYYVYQHSERKSLEAQIIYLNKKGDLSPIKKAPLSCPSNSYALDFKEGQHVGGPPVALSGYDRRWKQDTGIYIISLHEYSQDKDSWKLAIDFGTSHTVAAYQINGDPQPVNLDPELISDDGLSLHISENHDPKKISSMGFDLWRPTYHKEDNDDIAKALLPSDLWSVEELSSFSQEDFKSEWSPITHYSIPVMHIQRSNLRDHVISGFKWDLEKGDFRGEEKWLRERYLRMVLEIFVADIITKTKKLPKEIETTFTYPLRGTVMQATDKYEDVIKKAIAASTLDLGFKYDLCEGKGMYSESHAAYESVGDGIPINVKLVADLGGGTLDILIATFDIPNKRENNRFAEVEDSVRMGSDLLLEELAGNSEAYLPKGWEQDPKKAFEQLRAWMRSVGSEKLFGIKNLAWHSEELGLTGFQKSALGNDARALISRYFRIIVDFLSRYLVGYVAKDVLPKLKSDSDLDKLKILVNLRGNGWRLWPEYRNYGDIQRKMESLVKDRATQLWEAEIEDGLPNTVWHESILIHQNSPKIEPIKQAVGKSMDPKSASDRSHRFPLTRVSILRRGQDDKHRNWCEKIPFEGVGAEDSLQIVKFDPPLVVRAEGSGDHLVEKIEDALMKEINDGISGPNVPRMDGKVDPPIAVLIWEKLLKSDKFRKL